MKNVKKMIQAGLKKFTVITICLLYTSGKGDFRIYKYTKKDYVRSEKIKTSIALLISFLIMTGLSVSYTHLR